ncbi:hypothetical protein IF651_01630 [Cellulosimicrobium arenosum]|uniref:Uncharacterized protein n=1 Tax=Cellulosimicrobium arenosum TaxID=2708133 RepID=A0A927G670_9MICO|nr:hypothetical protein [Cellulosimicrobium arenosum]
MVATSIATEVALWIGLGQNVDTALYLLIGLGALMVGVVSILAIRYTELSSMLDRQLLGEYEEQFRIPAHLRPHYDKRFEDRIWEVSAQLPVERRERLFKRRIAKQRPPEPHTGEIPPLWRFDMLLSALGQPSIVFTAALAVAGSAGFGLGIFRASGSQILSVSITILSLILLALPWFASMQSAIGRFLRRAIAKLMP